MELKRNIECEIRGCITRGDFLEIKNSLKCDWEELNGTPELVIFFNTFGDLRLKINKFGCMLTLKKTIDRQTHTRKESELKFALENLNEVIEFLEQINCGSGLFSYCYRYDAVRDNQTISIKFDSKIGDVFEIEELVSDNAEFTPVYKRLKEVADKYGLKPWSQEAYHKIIVDSWLGAQPEPLLINGNFHPLISKVLKECKETKNSYRSSKKTLAAILKEKSNDYSALESKFKSKTKAELLSWKHGKLLNYGETVSIIIPTYNSCATLKMAIKSIEEQILHRDQKKLIEVIVVDDGSKDNTEIFFKNKKFGFNLRYIKQNNLGRAYARNLGVAIARGNILVFIDSDVILDRYFLNEHIARHKYLANIAVVSFKQNISCEDKVIKNYLSRPENIARPDITNDFRFRKTVQKSWLRMHRHVRNIEIRTVKILSESDNFKSFGRDKVLGVWDLPSMTITNALSIKKASFERIGGFNLQFNGWGMEDTFLGACLIADNNYIIPCFSTGIFHIEHPSRSGSLKKQIFEFNSNVVVYLDLLHRSVDKIFKRS